MDMSQVYAAKAGNAIVLQDFHTLEALGDKYSGVIKDVQVSKGEIASITKLIVTPAEGVEIAVVMFAGFREMPTPTFRMFRRYVDGPAKRIDDPRFIGPTGQFLDKFSQRFEDTPKEDQPMPYNMLPGFPWVASAEVFGVWEAPEDRADQNYWAKFCLAEMTNTGFGVVWFGWDISPDDVKLLT
jgi:hypothetical protein